MVDDEQERQTASVEDRRDPLGDLFASFRRWLSEAQGPDAIAEQRYLMGVAYGRVGRYAEAKAALATASDSVRYRSPASALLGGIYRDDENAVDATELFERAAAVTAPTPNEGWTLLGHLGTSLDGRDERARALAVFLELQGTAGIYRDVEQRVARLTTTLLGG